MTRPSYTAALDRLLKPLGFERDGRKWVRIRGSIRECVDLQKSSASGGVTANLICWDFEIESLLRSINRDAPQVVRPMVQRVSHLIDGRDRWWKNDPNGPSEVAEAVRAYGIPWLERVQSFEDQAVLWYGRAGTVRPWRNSHLPELAVTLYLLGELDEALALFDAPVPKTAIQTLVAQGRCVEQWLKRKKDELQ